MSIKPILFNTDMVRAILDGRKTVTRRAIKAEIAKNQEINKNLNGKFELYDISPRCGIPKGIFFEPPCRPGDILYVRETWAILRNDYIKEYAYKADDKWLVPRWHPSTHMPKEAVRLWLQVTEVGVERLQDITADECKAEGIYDNYKTLTQEYHDMLMEKAYPETFAKLWDSTIKKKDLPLYGWEANPWVFVVEFKLCEKPKERLKHEQRKFAGICEYANT